APTEAKSPFTKYIQAICSLSSASTPSIDVMSPSSSSISTLSFNTSIRIAPSSTSTSLLASSSSPSSFVIEIRTSICPSSFSTFSTLLVFVVLLLVSSLLFEHPTITNTIEDIVNSCITLFCIIIFSFPYLLSSNNNKYG